LQYIYFTSFLIVSRACISLRSEKIEKQVFYLSCPGLRYASNKAQPVSTVRTQAPQKLFQVARGIKQLCSHYAMTPLGAVGEACSWGVRLK